MLINTPITSIDDPRNLITLSQQYHTGVDQEDGGSGIGIHETSFPVWVIQVVAKAGFSPVPVKGETVDYIMKKEANL